MLIAFLDEFGHPGPFVSRGDRRFSQSPVFGLAGYILPHHQVRHFATFFFQLKANMLSAELKRNRQHPATWEKKGTDLITTKNIRRYRAIREGLARLLSEIRKCNGKIFFYGREKYQTPEASNASGLYTTVLSHSIRQLDDFCCTRNAKFLMILDQHSDRIKLLESATKTMFGADSPARNYPPPTSYQAVTAPRMVWNGVHPARRAVSTVVRKAASASAAHLAR